MCIPTKCLTALAAIALAGSANAAVIGFQAEDATTLGSNFSEQTSIAGSLGSYLDTTASIGGDNPSSSNEVASYDVTLPAGTYDLYARFYVGPGNASDDSFFVATDFGSNGFTAAEWFHVNQLGFDKNTHTDPDGTEIVNQKWVWLNLTDTASLQVESVGTYTSTGGTETFEYGHREDGLLIDAFAFVTSTESPSVADLDAVLIPEPASLALLAAGVLLVAGRNRR